MSHAGDLASYRALVALKCPACKELLVSDDVSLLDHFDPGQDGYETEITCCHCSKTVTVKQVVKIHYEVSQ